MATTAIGGSLTAASPLLAFQTLDAGVVGVEVSGGGWTGTITFEARIGNTWANAQVFTVAGVAAAATTTVNVSRLINTAGFSEVRANFSTPTSGSPTVIFTGSPEAMGGGGGGGGGGGAATIADGADVAQGSTTDAGIITDTSGTQTGFLRGAIIQWAKLLTQTGIVTETAPATDTASSGLNGRLQRIAQRLTSLIALFPTSLDGSGNFKVSLQTTLNEANDSVTGHIGGYSKLPTLTMTRPANTTPYTAGDEIADTAGTAAQRTFACARVNNGTGVITGASLIYSNNPAVTPVLELYLFDTDPTSAGDNAAFAPTDAQLATSIGVITFPAPKVGATGTGGNLLYDSGPLSIEFAATGGTTSIFGLLVTRIGFTPIANSEVLTLRLRVEMN